jgi:hypothetical protein
MSDQGIVVNDIVYELIDDDFGIAGPTEDWFEKNLDLRSSLYIQDRILFSRYELQYFESFSFSGSCLAKLLIPSTVERIGDNCFSKCKSLTEITFEFDSRLRVIGKFTFYKTAVRSVRIPSTVEYIAEKCFSKCKSLIFLKFESDDVLKSIGKNAFSCTALKTVQIPSSVEYIGERCFCKCKSLIEVKFGPNSQLKRIEQRTFSYTGLKAIQIPSTIEYLGKKSYVGCESLAKVLFDSNSLLREIRQNSFPKLAKIEIPAKCEILNGFSLWNMQRIKICKENPFFIVAESFLKTSDCKTLIRYFGDNKQVIIPKNAEILAKGCCCWCECLTEVIFEHFSKLRSLEKEAFSSLYLSVVQIPASV